MKPLLRTLPLTVLIALCIGGSANADRGSIPFKPGVQIFEPMQRALIAWNGDEEILILSTDLKASEATKILEVIPLPSEPKVTKGDVEVFRRATDLINKHLKERAPKADFGGRGVPGGAPEAAGEVTFHEKIGAHDVSVTRVLNSDGFVEWVEKYLRSVGVDNPSIPDPLKKVVQEYLDEKYGWFVFDVVTLEEELRTSEAIQYRFKTSALYYPLKITRTGSGDTSVELLVLTPRLLSKSLGLPLDDIRLMHQPITLGSDEVRSLSKDVDDLLGRRDGMKLRIWQVRGELSSFKADLILR